MQLPCPLGPYLLEARLGVGGMAEVFRARAFGASGFEKRVVIKTLRAELVGDGRFERMFLEEARIQASLSHRNLVQAHDLGVSEGRPWVRLDLVEGVDLASLHLPLPGPLAARVVAEVALALHAVHSALDERGRPLGIVHRDVSAKNVLLSMQGEVKLADFGIARATNLKAETRANTRKGTWAYVSPEQVLSQPLTAASDQFALATLTVELFTARRPFDADTPLATMERIREAAPPALDDLPPLLRPVLRRAFSRVADARFHSMRELRAAVLEATTPADELELADWLATQRAPRDVERLKTRIDTETP
jgi:eukaryotic-like serine/threonine-protein kinase